jgi:hypothetical protein
MTIVNQSNMVKNEFIGWRNFRKVYIPVFLLATTLISGSCKLDSQAPLVVDNKLDIYYENGPHQDLLDSTKSGSFREDSIHLYIVKDGVPTEVLNGDPFPHNFHLYKNEESQKYALSVFLETDTTYIRLNSQILDTITCKFNSYDNQFFVSKVWYNGILKWNDYASTREITVLVE